MNSYWTEQDFQVFEIPTLEERMEALTKQIRPKFEALGSTYSAYFSEKTGKEFFHHTAKHARRTVNPPKDSWVAFAPYKRGYKGIPHFQIGLWGTHIFVIMAVIYEAAEKSRMAEQLLESGAVHDLPGDFIISGDHMKPEASPIGDLSEQQLTALLTRLRDVKKGELVVGRHLSRQAAAQMSEEEFHQFAEATFAELLPVYETITAAQLEYASR